jgi:uncharacterized protein YigA (DUF484 family)
VVGPVKLGRAARAWDDYQEMRRLEKRIEEKQKMDEEHLRIIRDARSRAIEALAEMDPEQLATNHFELRHWITELIHYESLIMGEPETIEVQAMIVERLEQHALMSQELLDEGAIRLNAHHDQPKRENGEYGVLAYDEPD